MNNAATTITALARILHQGFGLNPNRTKRNIQESLNFPAVD